LVWDLGANKGVFSRVAGETGAYVISSDIDPAAVEQNYRQMKEEKTEKDSLAMVAFKKQVYDKIRYKPLANDRVRDSLRAKLYPSQ
jgi:ribosomal protein L11 methylase PrmA